ncbi:MAG: class I SAM-dependent methyltransferase [Candidatus Diapherotrites archaeon]
MKKIIKSCGPDIKRRILTEGINYFTTSKKSIWGKGDKETLELLEKEEINGKWLNLAAGDGRYNLNLLKKADFVVASDIDKSALSKLYHTTPKKFSIKLDIKVFDITKKFPFNDASFDGIFCAGFLHLFPKNIFRRIFLEMGRILKPNGKIIIDFATDIKRVSPDGKLIVFGDEPQYSLEEAKELLKETFRQYKIRIQELQVFEEEFKAANSPYKFSCKGVLLVAER